MREKAPPGRRRHRHVRNWLQVLGAVIGFVVVAAFVLSLVPAPTIWGSANRIDSSSGGGLQSVSCASISFCATFDYAGRLFVFNGHRWRQVDVNLLRKVAEPLDISCGAVERCMISNSAGDVFELRNSHLTRASLDSRGRGISAVSCSSATFCGAVGPLGAYIFDGTTWTAFSVDQAQGTLESISCTGRSFCAAGGLGAAIFNGRSWTFQALALKDGDELSQLSCATKTTCVGISLHGDWVKYSNGFWQVMGEFGGGTQSQGFTPKMLSCPTTTVCFAAATSGVVYELDGAKWSRLGYLFRESLTRRLWEIIAPTPAVSLSCPKLNFCVASDGGGNVYLKST